MVFERDVRKCKRKRSREGGACESQCPVGAISMGDGKFEIDADKCISCGACAAQCPVGTIEEE